MKQIKKLLWWLLAGTSGGLSRGRIIETVSEKPMNANEISDKLHLDYKTVRHHLKVLQKNNLLTTMGGGKYGAMYFPSEVLEDNMKYFDEIWDEIGKKKKKDENNEVKK